MSKKQNTKETMKSLADLQADVKKFKEELFQMQLDHEMRKLKNTRSLFLKRKEIARVLTMLHMQQLAEKMQNKKEVVNG